MSATFGGDVSKAFLNRNGRSCAPRGTTAQVGGPHVCVSSRVHGRGRLETPHRPILPPRPRSAQPLLLLPPFLSGAFQSSEAPLAFQRQEEWVWRGSGARTAPSQRDCCATLAGLPVRASVWGPTWKMTPLRLFQPKVRPLPPFGCGLSLPLRPRLPDRRQGIGRALGPSPRMRANRARSVPPPSCATARKWP